MSSDIKETFWKSLADSPIVMIGLDGDHSHRLPMTAQLDPEADHAIWFFASLDNRIARGGKAMAQFAAKGHDLFACVSGTLVNESDRAVLDRLWNTGIAAWYDGGKDDPKLVLLRFDLDDAEIWTADVGVKGMFKLMAGWKMESDERGKHAEVAL